MRRQLVAAIVNEQSHVLPSLNQYSSLFFSTRTVNKNNVSKEPNPSYVDLRHAPSSYLPDNAVVYNSFLTQDESNALVNDIAQKMKRRRYEKGHWDAVISKYKEVELSIPADFGRTTATTAATENAVDLEASCGLSQTSMGTIQRVRTHIESHHFASAGVPSHWKELPINQVWLPSHAIDLSKDGELKAHVDSVKFSGTFVAGLSLLSDCIMRLRPAVTNDDDDGTTGNVNDDEKKEEEGYIDLYLEQGSLYVLSHKARFEYTHELLPSGSIFTKFDNKEDTEKEEVVVERDHRFSVIFRDAKL